MILSDVIFQKHLRTWVRPEATYSYNVVQLWCRLPEQYARSACSFYQ